MQPVQLESSIHNRFYCSLLTAFSTCFTMATFIISVFIILTNFHRISPKEHGALSQQKCKEYAKAVYVKEYGPSNDVHEISECGIVSVPLIIGGTEAKEKEFPHMALIGFGTDENSEMHWSCGASLISENFILTASHCLQSREQLRSPELVLTFFTYDFYVLSGPAQKVRLGVLDIEKPDEEMEQEFTIIEKIQHPEFKKPAKYHDIALLRLNTSANFTAYVRPACLNTNYSIEQKKAIATGFGKTSFSDMDGSKHLMKVDLDIITPDNCKAFFGIDRIMPHGLIDEMLCAGVLQGGKDTCQGDSGGPLQVVLEEPYCMHSLIGVTSFGKFCGFANAPAIYSNIVHYLEWIEKTVWPNS